MSLPVFVTKSFLPSQEEYHKILSRAWDDNWITNRGGLVKELEKKIKEKLGLAEGGVAGMLGE